MKFVREGSMYRKGMSDCGVDREDGGLLRLYTELEGQILLASRGGWGAISFRRGALVEVFRFPPPRTRLERYGRGWRTAALPFVPNSASLSGRLLRQRP
jgi:hypothetical protein